MKQDIVADKEQSAAAGDQDAIQGAGGQRADCKGGHDGKNDAIDSKYRKLFTDQGFVFIESENQDSQENSQADDMHG